MFLVLHLIFSLINKIKNLFLFFDKKLNRQTWNIFMFIIDIDRDKMVRFGSSVEGRSNLIQELKQNQIKGECH